MNDQVVQQPSEAGAELARFRRSIMRQHFYGVVTGMCKSLIDAKAGAFEREFGSNPQFLELCRTDALIQIAEEIKRMNDFSQRSAPSAEKFLQHSQLEEYVCRRCGGWGTVRIENSANSLHRAARILVDHSQVNPRCPATKEDVVLRDGCSQQEWDQTKQHAIQAGGVHRSEEGGDVGQHNSA